MSKSVEESDLPPVTLCDVSASAALNWSFWIAADATFAQNCVSGATLPGDPQGSMISLGGLDCYVTAGAGNGEKAIVM